MGDVYGRGGADRRDDPPALIQPEGTVDSRRGGPPAAESKMVAEAARVIAQGTAAWTAPTGTASRATFDPATVTLVQLAQAVKALIDDMMANNLLSK
jgi:hypothetical protein